MIILLTVVCFLCGSLMFSYWLGLIVKKDIKTVGDGNPGAANLGKAAGYKYGAAGVVLDFLKAYLPLVWISPYVNGTEIISLALAPIFGHAFSPFLKFKGGKSIAVTFGVWSALTHFKVSIVYAIVLALIKVGARFFYKSTPSAKTDSLQILLGMLFLFIFLFYEGYPAEILFVWFGNFIVLAYKGFKS
jgi:acyl phosphate:glycerol-3-phosphate acyltransferase